MTPFPLLAEVLFIGNTLIGSDLPRMMERAAAAQGQEMRSTAQIIEGASLAWNWNNPPSGRVAQAALATGRIDHLVMTEAQPLAAHAAESHARLWADLALTENPDTKIWLYEGWQDMPADPAQDQAWRQRVTEDWEQWQALAAGAGPSVRVIPTGQALARLSEVIEAGGVPGLTSIRDAFGDDLLPNDRGLYLLAMVTRASLSGKDPRGLPPQLVRRWMTRHTVVDPDMAQSLQDIAWQVVQDHKDRLPPAVAANPLPAAPPMQADISGIGGVTAKGIGFGLAGIVDWSVQQPFLDIMKTARPWVAHLEGQWGGVDHEALARGGWLDTNGWVKALPPGVTGVSTLFLTDLPENAAGVAGRYVLTHAGKGNLTVSGNATVIEAAPGRVTFDYRPGKDGILLTIDTIDESDPLRDITILREDRQALYAGGEIFNPDWLSRIEGAEVLRFMDWMATNHTTLSRAEDRPKPGDYTWNRLGAPMEIMLALANRMQADAWFTLPHLAEEDLVRTYAELARDGLAPGLRAHVEYSNEVWNHGFPQAQWAEAQGRKRWGQEWKWVQFYALKATRVADIWAEVFAGQSERLVRVLTVQTGWKGLEADILNAPLVMAEGLPAPYLSFDAYAVTGYFGSNVGAPETADLLHGWLEESRLLARSDPRLGPFDLAIARATEDLRDGRHSGKRGDSLQMLVDDLLPYHAGVAARHGLDLVMYEGGTHAVGNGALQDDAEVTAFLGALNYSPEIAGLYRELLEGWRAVSSAPFNAFVDVEAHSRYGSWGSLRHLGDDNPRWRAIATGE